MISLLGFLITGPCWEISLPDTAIPARMRFEGPRRQGAVSVYTALTEFGVFSLELWVSGKSLENKVFSKFSERPKLLGADTLSGWRVEHYLAKGNLWNLEVPNTSIVLASRQSPCGALHLAFLVPGEKILFDEKRLIRAILSAYNLTGE